MSDEVNRNWGRLLILTGASGSGKTTITHAFRNHPAAEHVSLHFFDSIGVPSEEEMIAQFGSGEEWQRAMTHEGVRRLAAGLALGENALLEGQMRVSFVDDALREAGVKGAECWLVDCSDEVRRDRLIHGRNQPDLATDRMMNWAAFLRNEAVERGLTVLQTDDLTPEQSADIIAAHFQRAE